MSYDIVKSITIKDDKVYITSAANNIRPLTFERYESDYFSSLYQTRGLGALVYGLAVEVWNGNFHLRKGSQLCRNIQAAMDVLTYKASMRYFLDADHAAQYISEFVLNTMGKGPMPDVTKLYALRSDKEAVLEICKKNPSAFSYAAGEVALDRDVAKQYILNCRDMTMFTMPSGFADDKELALLALEGNGCVYRGLSSSVQEDKEITRLAFDPSRPRRYFEHLPDLIPEALRKDKAFMAELVALCPKMHLFRAPELLKDKDILIAWLDAGKWNPYSLRNIPKQHLSSQDIQERITKALKDNPEAFQKAQAILAEQGIVLQKPSLDTLLKQAKDKASGQQTQPVKQEPNISR